MKIRNVLLILAIGFGLLSCEKRDRVANSAPVPTSGIHGSVILYAFTLDELPEGETLLEASVQPLEAKIHVQDEQGNLIGATTSNSSGEFRMALAAGRYILLPEPVQPPLLSGAHPSPTQLRIEVLQNQYADARISYTSIPY